MRLRSGKDLNDMESSSRKNGSRKSPEVTLGMPTQASPSPPPEVPVDNVVSEPITTTVTTSFIRQQIDMGIHDIMYQLSQQLSDIVKPMVHNEVQQARDLENRGATAEHSANSASPSQVNLVNHSNQTGPHVQPSLGQAGLFPVPPNPSQADINMAQPSYAQAGPTQVQPNIATQGHWNSLPGSIANTNPGGSM